MDFGMKLQNLRKGKGLSQEALAEQLNVSRQAVSKWESGAGYPEMDKLILLSNLFGVTIDYLVKDNHECNQDAGSETDSKYFMTHEKIQDYLKYKKNFGMGIGACVSMIILSVCMPILCEDSQYETIGTFGFLAVVAIAVFGMIILGIKSESYGELEKQEINMSFQDLQDLQKKHTKFQSQFGVSIAFGVFLIIMSVAIIVFLDNTGYGEKASAAQLMVCVAFSVFIFIYQGIKYTMYQFLVQNKKHIEEMRKEEKSLFSLTMPLAAMVYLILGFTQELWHPGWIIFPIVAIITAFIERIRY
ncbi:helix-turn-helix domain-containing protein [Candidatus Stoquefichus sp. SB1]|uniref:helix-turn-helix domain-containing protein n=1 Tax=Candidatus Stoquefichus sp. SB1 TaxID=1658109 RepID=UPI00067EC9CC|nr:helix-turn-helix transcriptional regulator [Candidatus Stoquefichus sp. SB1]